MNQYDVIVVGGRCGGAPLSMLLARAGLKVLLLDRMAFGSDIMSTHFVKRGGVRHLQRWGLLERLDAIGTPAIRQLNFHIGGVHLRGQAPPFETADRDYTPRRFHLDRILVDAAIAAGVEARDRFAVSELLFENGRVAGIRGGDGDGGFTAHARMVVGADGVCSFVAGAVGALPHVDAGIHTCGYYAYYSGMREADDEASLHVLLDPRRFYITFPTNDGLDMVFLFWPASEADRVRADRDAAFEQSLSLVPALHARTLAGKRETRISGTHLMHNYFRRAHGPGWALVGDAALHRDPITAQGISNAFTQASILAEELIAAAAGDGDLDAAAARYDRRQYDSLRPMFDYTVHTAMLQPPSDELRALLPVLVQDETARNAFLGAFIGSVPLEQVYPSSMIQRFAEDVARANRETRHEA